MDGSLLCWHHDIFSIGVATDVNGTTRTLLPWLPVVLLCALLWQANAATAQSEDQQNEYIEELNQLRDLVGLRPLQYHPQLSKAAEDHARYTADTGYTGHLQDTRFSSYTGRTPSDRAARRGYVSRKVVEAVHLGDDDVKIKTALLDLMDTLYHRLGLLSPSYDQVGIARVKAREGTSLVILMGNSVAESLCENAIDLAIQTEGVYTVDVCKDKDRAIRGQDWQDVEDLISSEQPSILLWPPQNLRDVRPELARELPSPVPGANRLGNAITAQFNSAKGEFEVQDLRLFIDLNESAIEVTGITMDHETDPHNILTKDQIAFIPDDPLDFDTEYEAWIRYLFNGRVRERRWTFSTEDLEWPVIELHSGPAQSYEIPPQSTYALLIPRDRSLSDPSELNIIRDIDVQVSAEVLSGTVVLLHFDSKICGSMSLYYLDYSPVHVRFLEENNNADQLCLQRLIDSLPGTLIYGLGETLSVKNRKRNLFSLVPASEKETLGRVVWAAKESIEVQVKQKGLLSMEISLNGKSGDTVQFQAGSKKFTLKIK